VRKADNPTTILCRCHEIVNRNFLEPSVPFQACNGTDLPLHNGELKGLYCSPNIVRVIKSKRMRWAGHVALMGEGEACTGFWWGNLRERDYWGDPGVDGRIILRYIFRKWVVGVWTGSSWLMIGTGGGHL